VECVLSPLRNAPRRTATTNSLLPWSHADPRYTCRTWTRNNSSSNQQPHVHVSGRLGHKNQLLGRFPTSLTVVPHPESRAYILLRPKSTRQDKFPRSAVNCGLHRDLLLWCQQHVVQRLETEPLRLLDHEHGTVYLSSSPTARHLSSSRNISRLIYLVYLFRARIDCVKRPSSILGRLYDAIILSNYITLHTLHSP